jgi:hypothetical protein
MLLSILLSLAVAEVAGQTLPLVLAVAVAAE